MAAKVAFAQINRIGAKPCNGKCQGCLRPLCEILRVHSIMYHLDCLPCKVCGEPQHNYPWSPVSVKTGCHRECCPTGETTVNDNLFLQG